MTAGFPPFRLLIAHASEDEHLGRAVAPPGLLGPAEAASLARLTVPARRRKWLLGRWAAKRLLGELVAEQRGARVPPTALAILNEPSGLPYATLEGEGRLPWSISISHRSELGLAAVLLDDPARASLGADLELVEARDPALVRGFFTDAEAAEVARAPAAQADRIVARTWSAKEAVLKALGVGLRLDTRTLEIGPAGPDAPRPPPGWAPLELRWLGPPPAPAIALAWRDDGAHVITVAVRAGG